MTEPPVEEAVSVPRLHEPIMREQSEPRDGHEPLPLWLVFFAFGLVGWGGWYLGAYTADFRADVFDPGQISLGVQPPATELEEASPEVVGARVYRTRCASCHQLDGSGVAASYPPLAESEWVSKAPGVVVRIVLDGLAGPIEVRGQRYSSRMPGWRTTLDDAQIAAVLSHVRRNFGNAAPPIEPAFVAAVRERTADRGGEAWSPDALLAMEDELADEASEPAGAPAGADAGAPAADAGASEREVAP